MSAHFQILVTVGKKINIQGWSVLKGGPSVECSKKIDNLKSTLQYLVFSQKEKCAGTEIEYGTKLLKYVF